LRFDALRIALVGPLPPPSGGMANQTAQLARLLEGEGATVEIAQVNAPYRPAWVGRLRGLRALFRLVPYLVCLWRTAGRVDVLHVMANSGWSWHLCAAPAVWVGWLTRTPVVVNYRGGEAEAFFDRSWRAVRLTLARAQALVVPSAFLESVFAARGVEARVVPNIIDLERFAPSGRIDAEPDELYGWPHVVVTRNLEPVYDIATALRAFASIRGRFAEARLTVAGEGPERAPLERLAGTLGIAQATRFSGRLDNAEVARLYREADLMLNPSLADNMPISILEALASGVPVVSTEVGGVPHVVEDGRTARLVPAGDAERMAQAGLTLLEDRAVARAQVGAGLEAAKRFAWPSVRERWLAIYSSLPGLRREAALARDS